MYKITLLVLANALEGQERVGEFAENGRAQSTHGVPASGSLISVSTAVSTVASVGTIDDIGEGGGVGGSNLVEGHVEETEGGLALVEELVVDEGDETGEGGGRARGSVDGQAHARALVEVSSVVAGKDDVVVSVERNIGVGPHLGVEGERGGELIAVLDPGLDGSGLVGWLRLEGRETSTSGDSGTGGDGSTDLLVDAVSVPGELGGSNGGDIGRAGGPLGGEDGTVGLVEGVGGDGESVGGVGSELRAVAGRVEVVHSVVVLLDGELAVRALLLAPGGQGVLGGLVSKNELAGIRAKTHGEEAEGVVVVSGEGDLIASGGSVVASASGAVDGGVHGAVAAGTVQGRSTIITIGDHHGNTHGSKGHELSVGSVNVLGRVVSEGVAVGGDRALVEFGPSVGDGVNQGRVLHVGDLLGPVQDPLAVAVGQEHGGHTETDGGDVLNIEVRLVLVAAVVEAVGSLAGDVDGVDLEVRVELLQRSVGEVVGEGSNTLEVAVAGSSLVQGDAIVSLEDGGGDELVIISAHVLDGAVAGVVDELGDTGDEVNNLDQLGGDVGEASDPEAGRSGLGGPVEGEGGGEKLGGVGNRGGDLNVVREQDHITGGDARGHEPLNDALDGSGSGGNHGLDFLGGEELAIVLVAGVAHFPEGLF